MKILWGLSSLFYFKALPIKKPDVTKHSIGRTKSVVYLEIHLRKLLDHTSATRSLLPKQLRHALLLLCPDLFKLLLRRTCKTVSEINIMKFLIVSSISSRPSTFSQNYHTAQTQSAGPTETIISHRGRSVDSGASVFIL
jgi:hypothetical protein